MKVKRGEFVCIIGDVGCGKSSLLSSIIGDMLYLPPDYVNKVTESSLSIEELKLVSSQLAKEKLQESPIKLSGRLCYVE